MNQMTPKMALLIPTRNRRNDLHRLFKSLMEQSRKPDYLLMIDGGEDLVEDFLKLYPDLPLHYIRVYPPGLCRQRNAGLEKVPAEMNLIGFIDDDLELFPDAVEKMVGFWAQADANVGGVSFHIVNNDTTKSNWLRRFFFLCGSKGGIVLPSGFNHILFPVNKDTETEWLCGGATVWRASLFKDHRFEEHYPGYGHFDDVDFSLSLARMWKFWVIRDSKVYHHSHPFRKDKLVSFGASDTINRYLFVRRFELSLPAFAWATLGQITGTFLSGIVRRDRSRVDLAWGSLRGVGLILQGRTDQVNALDVK
jgi:glycosyltransferase involved in cell wall biosynthesis